MSEFGNETATATLKAGEKVIDALMKFLKYLMSRNDRLLRKEQLKRLKVNNKSKEAKDFIDKQRGYVKTKKLFNSGEKLIPLAVSLSSKELQRFNKLAKIMGVPYTAIANQNVISEIKETKKEINELKKIEKTEGYTEEQAIKLKELTNKLESLEKQRQERIVVIRAKDLELVKDITERMNTEISFNNIDAELALLMEKGEENLTDQERDRVNDLLKEKEQLLKGEFDHFNERNSEEVINGSLSEEGMEMGFESAVNRVTDREYSEAPIYICDRINPENYIETKSQPMEHKGRVFTNTEFRVFNSGEEQKCDEFSHGKFSHYSRKDGENSSYGSQHWQNMKKEMKEKGGFSDNVIILNNKEDYVKYKEVFLKEKEKTSVRNETVKDETINAKEGRSQYKDYAGQISHLNEQLSASNMAINSTNEIYMIENGEAIQFDDDMNQDEKIRYQEAVNIGKQIEIYKELNETQTQLAFINQQMKSARAEFIEQGKPDALKNVQDNLNNELYAKSYNLTMQIPVLEVKLNNIKRERESLTSLKVMNELKERDKPEDRGHENREKMPLRNRKEWSKAVDGREAATINEATNNKEATSFKVTDRSM